jgi:hypothetical protein
VITVIKVLFAVHTISFFPTTSKLIVITVADSIVITDSSDDWSHIITWTAHCVLNNLLIDDR